MTVRRNKIAERIHEIYSPGDPNCHYTDNDWAVAGEIEQLQADIGQLKKRISKLLDAGTDLAFTLDNTDFVNWCRDGVKDSVVNEAKDVLKAEQALKGGE